MSKFSYCFMVLALVGCEKSMTEQQKEVSEARQQVDVKTAAAVEGTRQKVEAAQNEANKEMAATRAELQQRTQAAVKEGNETVRTARQDVQNEAHDSALALRKSGADLRRPIEAELDDLDKRAQTVRSDLAKKTGAARARAETQLNDISLRSQALRSDLREFEAKTIKSMEDFKGHVDQRLTDLHQGLERAESGS
jgi:hypothetical protein